MIGIAALAVVLYFFYQNPRETFRFLAVVVAMAGTANFIMQLGSSTDTGMSAKKAMSTKTKKALGD